MLSRSLRFVLSPAVVLTAGLALLILSGLGLWREIANGQPAPRDLRPEMLVQFQNDVSQLAAALALEGAVVPAGSDPEEDTDVIVVKPSSVGGVKSYGMLCDALGEHSAAFQSFRRAAKLRRGGYNADVHAKMTSRIIDPSGRA